MRESTAVGEADAHLWRGKGLESLLLRNQEFPQSLNKERGLLLVNMLIWEVTGSYELTCLVLHCAFIFQAYGMNTVT